jgi:hypothetical protein
LARAVVFQQSSFAMAKINLVETLTASYRAQWPLEYRMNKRAREKEAPASGAKCDGKGYAFPVPASLVGAMAFAALGLLSAAYALEPPCFYAEAQIQTGPRASGVIGLRAAAGNSNSGERLAGPAGQAQLLASRDLARRVIKELRIDRSREFDPATRGLGLGSRALVFLGIRRDPARNSVDDRVLEAFQERLRISGPDSKGLLFIGVQSENPELAASAANRLAELYTEMRANVQKAVPRRALAHIVAFASVSQNPVRSDTSLLLAGAAAAAVLAACAALTWRRLHLRGIPAEPMVRPNPFEGKPAVARVKLRERFSPRLTARLDPLPPRAAETGGENRAGDELIAQALARIIARRAHAARGIRILAAAPLPGVAGTCLAAYLARKLAQDGQAIAIFPEGLSIGNYGGPNAPPCLDVHCGKGARPGDLVAGSLSFTEAIRRDPASRLHLLQIAQSCEADSYEVQTIIDALVGTYDYVVTLAQDIDETSLSKILAQKSDFVLLPSPACASGPAQAAAMRLIESCAGEVLLFGSGTEDEWTLALSAA